MFDSREAVLRLAPTNICHSSAWSRTPVVGISRLRSYTLEIECDTHGEERVVGRLLKSHCHS